ncbi:ABC transporter ATP-binding protein [Gulosibacter bifidus]|uniref:ABC transporter ATP-binding protein n=1 Tax=Gulosibacter bifidus TaxID=272239 RepID=A0ABW5RHU1_9MICO|nr:ABC transporter ATP-binding protein [Gulosibacter bifidus]
MSALIRLFRFTKELTPYYIAIVVCAVIGAIAGLVVPFLIGAATDHIVAVANGKTPFEQGIVTVIWFAVAFLIAEIFAVIASAIGGYFGDVMSARMRATMSNRYYDKLLQLPQSYFDDELTGTIVSRLDRTITEVTHFIKAFSNNFFTMMITTAAVLVISALYAWPLALLLALIFPVYIWLTALTSKHWQRYEGDKNEHVDAARGRFSEVMQQMQVVKSFVQERHERKVFRGHFGATIDLTKQQSTHWHRLDALRRIVLAVVFFAIYLIIFWQTATGVFSLGSMVLLIQLVSMARTPVTMMSYIIDTAQHAIAGSKDYFEVMALQPDPREYLSESDDEPTASAELSGAVDTERDAIAFHNVDFAYETDREVLQDVSFTIRRGERVAFVSESGGGKSTIVSLLLGFYPVTSGRVELFGRDIAQQRMAGVRQQIGVVFQRPALFSGTIRENIAYANPNANEAEIIAAAKRANAWDFIERAPEGLDSLIGEQGLKLSGGQQQRIAVARAMLKDAPVLILDEATSALDTRSERLVQQGIDELMLGRTSLIIAHRLSTIASVDRIVTIRDGRVDEVGSPDELATTGGIYAELLALQLDGSAKSKAQLKKRFGITT